MTELYKIEDRHLNEPKKRGDLTIAFCPFHKDTNNPNLTVYPNRNGYKCFTCGAHGNAFNFLKETGQLPPKQSSGRGRPSTQPTKKDVEATHKKLLDDKEFLDRLKEKRGWTIEIIKKLKLGKKNHFLTIPIFTRYNNLINIRLYDPFWEKGKKTGKTMSWAKGLGSRADIYLIDKIKDGPVIVCEGEPDAITLFQLGFNAACFTCGIKGITDKALNGLVNEDVVLIFDIDEEGIKAARRITKYLVHICKSVKNVKLPIEEPPNGDVSDYLNQGYGKKDLEKLIKNTAVSILPTQMRDKIAKMKPVRMHLAEAAIAENTAKKQEINVIVAGKDLVPYLIPKKVSVSCLSGSRVTMCVLCGLTDCEEKEVLIGPYDPEILLIVGCTENYARGVYRRMADIPKKCTTWTYSILETQNVEDVFLIPDIEDTDDLWRPYVQRSAYIVNCPVDTNKAYKMIGWTTSHPNTHHVAHIIETVEASQSNLDSFEMDEETEKSLQIFKPLNGQSVIEKINEIHKDLSENITHIWERNDMLWLVDLSFHSVLSFNFQGIPVQRGWVEVLLLSDTRQGKSTTLMKMVTHNKAGEIVSAENTSYAGLVGGISSVGNRNMITWGKLPLNDTRLVAIEEFSGLKPEDIARLSGVRSSGIAEITKIQTEKTRSRVRLIVMSNPVRGDLRTYAMGVYALKDLISQPEDIARFDLVLTMAAGEIKPEILNRRIKSKTKHIYNSKACSNRVRFAWSRKPEHIIFTEDAVDLILLKAIEQSRKYHPSIPLVEASEQRIKIARLAISCAIMCCSIIDGENVLVTEEHVDAVLKIMEHTYTKPSMGYDHYSDEQFMENELVDKEKVKEAIVQLGPVGVVTLLGKTQIQLGDMEDLCDSRDKAKKLLSFLTRNRALKKPYSVYKKTPPFTRLLIEIKKEMDELGSSYFDGVDEKQDGEQEDMPF
jgi:5S rRNA maturation endonuclease (ribonuclease M5)